MLSLNWVAFYFIFVYIIMSNTKVHFSTAHASQEFFVFSYSYSLYPTCQSDRLLVKGLSACQSACTYTWSMTAHSNAYLNYLQTGQQPKYLPIGAFIYLCWPVSTHPVQLSNNSCMSIQLPICSFIDWTIHLSDTCPLACSIIHPHVHHLHTSSPAHPSIRLCCIAY